MEVSYLSDHQRSIGLIAPHCTKWYFNGREDVMQLQGTWHNREYLLIWEDTYRYCTDNNCLVPLHTNTSTLLCINSLLNLSLEERVIFAHFKCSESEEYFKIKLNFKLKEFFKLPERNNSIFCRHCSVQCETLCMCVWVCAFWHGVGEAIYVSMGIYIYCEW